MIRTQLLAVCCGVLFLLGTATSQATAQQPTAQAGGGIAVIDIGKVLREYPRLQQSKEALKAEVQRADASMKTEAEALQAMMERTKELKPGSQDYKQLEANVANKRASMTVAVQLQRKEFMQKEANIYHTAYREIQDQVRMLASQYGIVAVFETNTATVDMEQPGQMLADIQKSLVWYHPNLDITQLVLNNLIQRSAVPAASRSGGHYPARSSGIPGPPRR